MESRKGRSHGAAPQRGLLRHRAPRDRELPRQRRQRGVLPPHRGVREVREHLHRAPAAEDHLARREAQVEQLQMKCAQIEGQADAQRQQLLTKLGSAQEVLSGMVGRQESMRSQQQAKDDEEELRQVGDGRMEWWERRGG